MNTMLRPPHSQDAPATPFRRAAGPLVALMLGASLLGSAQAKDAIRWQKPGWHFISRIMYQQDIQKNLKLRKNNISSQSLGMPEARLVTRYQHDDHWGFVFDIEPYVSLWRADGNPQENDTMLYLPQLYAEAQFKEYGTRARLGRWSTDDERTWFFDTDFDGLNVTVERGPWLVDAFVAQYDVWRHDLFNRNAPHEKGDKLAAAMGTYRLNKDHQLILKGLRQVNDKKEGMHLTHLIGGSINTPSEGMQHWALASYVSGHQNDRRVRGEAIDVGATLFVDSSSRWNPRATLGYAWGSGDDGKGTDNSHHQTGMQTNKSEMGAVYDFKTYGTVLNPALTNIHVLTAAVGIAPMKDSSLDLVYHHYRQDKLGALSKTALNPEADLQNRRTLGNGFDLVWGWTPGPAWKVQAYAGVFMPSGRFRASTDAGAGKSANAYAAGIDIRYYPGR